MVQLLQTDVGDQIQRQRQFFATGKTRSLDFRITQLQRLRKAVIDAREHIVAAMAEDLGRPEFETIAFEIGIVKELDHTLKHLKAWMRPKKVSVSLEQMPARARVHSEPLGIVLIIAPWNYPVQLSLNPLVGAIAAGNCVTLKPSELAPETSRVLAELLSSTFEPDFVQVMEGGVETSQALLEQRFDHVFFTGGTAIGKVVMEAAAKHLTPVTLELGGKSPCIVDSDIDLETAVRRIVWGKFINAGQTCIAPDYLLVNRTIKPQLVEQLKTQIQQNYGDDPSQSPDLGRIVNDRHFQRVIALLDSGTTLLGGDTDASQRYIAPTLLDNVSPDDPVMQEEIFGPILPVLEYGELDEAIAFINHRPKPLALYVFSRTDAVVQQVLEQTSSGGVCINDTILQLALPELPFGGVGNSGIGHYHGKNSFDTFSHQKSVFSKPFWLDLDWRYPPYKKKLGLIKRLMS